MSDLKLYTDGACSGNPGPGGWGFAIIQNNEVTYSDADFNTLTTNNKMELSAVIFGLEHLLKMHPETKAISVHTDSAYTMNAMKDWVHNWRKNDWKKSNGKPIENPELIKRLYQLCYESGLNINWVKVKAHQKIGTKDYDAFNDYVDQLATGNISPKKTM